MLLHPVGILLPCGHRRRDVGLVKEGVDCALRGGESSDSRLVARHVGDLRLVLCAAPQYIDRYGLPGVPDDLPHHQQAGYVAASTGTVRPVTLMRDGRTLEFEVPARFVTTDSAASVSAGLDGMGLVVLAEFVAGHCLASGALVRVLPGWHCPPLPLHLLTLTTRLPPIHT